MIIPDIQTKDKDQFTLRAPTRKEIDASYIESQMIQTEIDLFDKEARELLTRYEHFDPSKNIENSDKSYIEKAYEFRENAKKLFSKPVNNAATVWEKINVLIKDMYDRLLEISERHYPTKTSEYEYIRARSKKETNVTFEKQQREKKPDIEFAEMEKVSIFCMASEESFRLNNQESTHSQDAAGVRQLMNRNKEITGYHLIQTDGVGQSFRSEFLAKELVKALLKYPGLDTDFSVLTARLYDDLLSLDGLENLPDLVLQSLTQVMNESGSSSAVNQLIIGLDGKVGGIFRGDGILGVIRKNGERMTYHFGSHESVLQTKKKNQGEVLYLQDIIGEEIRLEPGDHILLSSDGLGHGEGKFEQILELISSVENKEELKNKILEILWQDEKIEDDKSLLIYSA